jgi:hypothetical protein
VVARKQLGRPAGTLVTLRVAPALFRIGRGLRFVVVRDVVEHEAAPFAVLEHAALAANAFGDQNPAHAWRPDHPRRMELDEFHVDQLGTGAIRQRVAVARALPAVAGDLVGAPDAAGRQHDRLRRKDMEAAAFPVVGQHTRRPAAVEQQLDDGVLHVHGHPEVDGVILERSNQLEAGAIADVSETRIAMAAEVALVDAPVRRAIEDGAPALELSHAIRRLLRVQFSHAPVVDVLPAAHRVGEVHAPAVAVVVVRHRRRHAAFGHDGVGLAQQRLADQSDRDPGVRRLDGGAQAGAAGADDEDVVVVGGVRDHQRILKSEITPSEQSLM